MSLTEGPVRVTREGGLMNLRFMRPLTLNAINQDLADSLRDACHALAENKDMRALLISGEGRSFMAGGDLSSFHAAGDNAPAVVDAIIEALHDAVQTLVSMPVPVVAAVHGPVAGAGISMMLAADIIIAAEEARFILAYPRIGTSPDGGATWSLPRAIGLRRALGFALLGDEIDANTALEIGLVNRVVPQLVLADVSREIAQRLAIGPTQALGRTKALLRVSLDRDLTQQLAAERDSFVSCAGTEDFREGVAAFLQKRTAKFIGE